MKNLKYVLFIALTVVSFYLTDKIIIYMENRHPIMQEIDARLDSFRIEPANAKINDNTIIPGINGKSVNRRRSYAGMGEFGAFNETFIVFDTIRPEISLQDKRHKVIVRGNPAKRQVALVIETSQRIIDHLEGHRMNFTLIADANTDLLRHQEYIPGEKERDNIRDLHFILNRRRVNSGICLIGFSNLEFCVEKNYYLVEPTLDTNQNITEVISNIRSGDIILLRNNINPTNINLILNEIRRQDLEVVPLSSLISENR